MINELSQKQKQEFVFGIRDDEAITNFKNWTEQQAMVTAKSQNIVLTDAHWKVIHFLRTHFENTGEIKHARELAAVLVERFSEEGGSRYLYQLFPDGPVNQGCQIAGIPVPKDATNGSFGYQV